jgi:hypothetical protein
MKRWIGYAVLCLWMATLCYSQDAQQAKEKTAETKISFPVTLEKTLDSKKLKEGDTVICLTAGTLRGRNGFLIPSGSKVTGHVTQAQARAKGDSNSTLGIAFDKIQVSGKELPMTGTLQAIAPSLGSSGPSTGPAAPPSLGGGGPAAAAGGSAGTTAGPTTSMKLSGPSNGTPVLIASSTGVLGIKAMEMDANGMITSPGKQVKLDNGTQMMIRAEIQMPSQ